jgi:Xaa-Pro aminopeptidase
VGEWGERLARLGAALATHDVPALLVTAPTNVRYLTGYAGTNGAVVVRPDGATFLTDFRYAPTARAYEAFVDVAIIERDLLGSVARLMPQLARSDRVGFETSLSYGEQRRLDEGTEGIELVALDGVVEHLRRTKSELELAAIRHAMDELERVYQRIAEDGLVGRTEAEVAWAIERQIREAGFPGLSFPPIVAAGPYGGSPHTTPRDEAIPAGTLVVVDIGAQGESGYCSDCTRTFAAGPGLPDAAREEYAIVLEAQLAGLAAVRAGTTGVDADAAARSVIAERLDAALFGHGLGHGIGLDVHEAPTLSTTSTDTLLAGDVCSVEPGVYRPDAWGIRIEDAVVVTEDGCDILTGFTKALLEV